MGGKQEMNKALPLTGQCCS